MKNKILVLFIFLTLLLTSLSSSALRLQNTNSGQSSVSNLESNNDADVPVWDVGDSWTYECFLNGGLEDFIDLNNLKFDNLEFVVSEVQNDFYKMDMSGDVSGLVTVDLGISISGSLRSTTIEGDVYVNKSNLFIEKVENFLMSGGIKPGIGPQIGFDVDGIIVITHGISVLDFPFNRDDAWLVDEISVNINGSVNVGSLLSEDLDITIYIQEHMIFCEKWDNLEIQSGNYDALKLTQYTSDPLSDEEHNIWFSPAVGNIVKVQSREIPFSWGGWGYYDIDMELLSTNYEPLSNPPSIPDKPTGPEVLDVGFEGTFESSATDQDGDIIKLIFDWGDGDVSYSDFVESGEIVTMSHVWTATQDDPFEVKVKARDKYGKESDWSDVLSVEVINNPPEKPATPNGPKNGKGGIFGNTYTYKTSSNDPNLHKVRCGWDWNGDMIVDYWTGFIESGAEASGSYKWTDKGNYEIRVKAEDEYGELSEWSEPLVVSMPKLRNINFNRHPMNSKFIEKFPLLYEIISNFGF